MIEILIVGSVAGALAATIGGMMTYIYRTERRRIVALAGGGAEALERKLSNAPQTQQQPQLEATVGYEAIAPARRPLVEAKPSPEITLGEDIPVLPLEANQSELDANLIDRLMLDDVGEQIRQHYRLMGATRTGKTTLGEHLIRRIQGNKPAQKFLINPKHRESNPSWSIPPFVKTIEQSLEGLQRIELLLKQRIEDPQFNPDNEPLLFAIVDEWDWIYEVHKDKALASLRALFKVGAELGIFVVLLGQSPLSKDTGLSQSDNQNFCQIIIGSEAMRFLAGSSFFQENREELRQEASRLSEEKARFALVIPREGKAFISAIPFLGKPSVPTAIRNQKTEECEVLTPEQCKLAFLYSLPAETPQHEQGLPPHLRAIIDYAKVQGGSVSVRQVQQRKLIEIVRLEANKSEAIQDYFRELEFRSLATLSGEGGGMTLALATNE